MSRYNSVDIITYNDKDGNEYPVRDIREIPTYRDGRAIKLERDAKIDEIITREDVYGPDTEDFSYTVTDHNLEVLAEHDFDLSRIKSLRIPVVDEI